MKVLKMKLFKFSRIPDSCIGDLRFSENKINGKSEIIFFYDVVSIMNANKFN